MKAALQIGRKIAVPNRNGGYLCKEAGESGAATGFPSCTEEDSVFLDHNTRNIAKPYENKK